MANWKTYVPAISPVTFVIRLLGDTIVGVLGPETFVHKKFESVPYELPPFKVTEDTGSVTAKLFPALGIGVLSGRNITSTQ